VPDHLFILLGAGASFDCASNYVTVRAESRPPLTTELFDSRFEDILHFYPLAETAAAEIQPAVERGPIAIEQFLREKLRDSPHLHRRQMFRAVPLYLQHLLFNISSWEPSTVTGYTRHPDNYSRLVSTTLDLDEAVFITLNYDILLDRRLFAHGPALNDIDSYIGSDKNWSLIKLHGSVNWARRVLNEWTEAPTDPYMAATISAIGDDLALDHPIELRLHTSVGAVRHEGGSSSQTNGSLFYPALSAPLGPGDELVCPDTHVEHLRKRLQARDGLHLLVIGYSGLDEEVLRLFGESDNHLRSLTVVSNSEEAAILTKNAITSVIGLGGVGLSKLFVSGFDEFARSGELQDRIADLR